MTCEPHQEAEELDRRLEEEQRRERESWGIPAPAETSPARVEPVTVDELTDDEARLLGYLADDIEPLEPGAEWPALDVPAGVTVDLPPAVLDSPYPPAPPTVDELGRITVPLNLKR